MFGTLDFMGQLIGSLILPVLADKCGKRYFTFIATYCLILIYAIMLTMSQI
jgi:hypothetical protein